MIIATCITAHTTDELTRQLKIAILNKELIHLDYADATLNEQQLLLPDHKSLTSEFDLHIMSATGGDFIKLLKVYTPRLVIFHGYNPTSSEIELIRAMDIKVGIAIENLSQVLNIEKYDHILVFSGSIGKYGGIFDPAKLKIVKLIRSLSSDIEIGWDGGINDYNLLQLQSAGVNLANIGGFIQKSQNPSLTLNTLNELLK